MDSAEQKTEFEKLTARAKKAGLLKACYPEHGVAILVVSPASPAAAAAEPAATPVPDAAPAAAAAAPL
jgi:hypothetical protein